MKEFDLIKIQAYEFQADDQLVKEVLSEVKNLQYTENTSNWMSQDNYYNSKLFIWFSGCLEEIKNFYYKKELKLEITECWANKTTKLQMHHKHLHRNSIVSGIFYLTTHEDSETFFYFKNPWLQIQESGFLNISAHNPEDFMCQHSVKPTAGKLILFPSHIPHHVKTLKDNQVRYTLSFNTFITGEVSNNFSTYLKLKSIPKIENIKNESSGLK